ncbi:MAG TPA: metalloregulator ArsR/SmtB family transcription factor [Ktedonobacteraceae bacterium]|jgi:ArsR family transcriptional regulator|nr:metalloregulator ArsR/SmtB family transcription factor [Ktedonobacteraceae bacterium]
MNDWRELKIVLKALGDMARLTIVYHLVHEQEITVTALTELLGISQPLVSWHLRKLRKAGIIQTRRVGRQVYCSLNAERIAFCIDRLEQLLDPSTVLEALPSGPALMEAELSLED